MVTGIDQHSAMLVRFNGMFVFSYSPPGQYSEELRLQRVLVSRWAATPVRIVPLADEKFK